MTIQEQIDSITEFIADAKLAQADGAYKQAFPVDHANIAEKIDTAETQLNVLYRRQ